jgi:hypothetical protein
VVDSEVGSRSIECVCAVTGCATDCRRCRDVSLTRCLLGLRVVDCRRFGSLPIRAVTYVETKGLFASLSRLGPIKPPGPEPQLGIWRGHVAVIGGVGGASSGDCYGFIGLEVIGVGRGVYTHPWPGERFSLINGLGSSSYPALTQPI